MGKTHTYSSQQDEHPYDYKIHYYVCIINYFFNHTADFCGKQRCGPVRANGGIQYTETSHTKIPSLVLSTLSVMTYQCEEWEKDVRDWRVLATL